MTHETINLQKGVSHTPHDSAAPNGAVAVALDLVNDNGAYQPIEQPAVLVNLNYGEKCLAIHQNGDYKHYIIALGNTLYWIDADDNNHKRNKLASVSTVPTITVVGNTLVATFDDEMRYYLYRPDDNIYTDLGYRPPMPQITFGLMSEFKCYPDAKAKPLHSGLRTVDRNKVPIPTVASTSSFVPPRSRWNDFISHSDGRHQDFPDNFSADDWSFSLKDVVGTEGKEPVDDEVQHITEFTMAGVNAFVKQYGENENRFIMPFFIRYAYEMYDGTLFMHSTPVLMIPNSRGPVFGLFSSTTGYYHDITSENSWDDHLPGLELDWEQDDKMRYGFRGRVYGFASTLSYNLSLDGEALRPWKDLIRGINVYVTPGIYRYNQGGKVYGWTDVDDPNAWKSYFGNTGNRNQGFWQNNLKGKRVYLADAIAAAAKNNMDVFAPYPSKNHPNPYRLYPSYILSLDYRTEAEMTEAYERTAQFYKIYSWDFDDLIGGQLTMSGPLPIEEGTLRTLTGREVMTDDWGSHDKLSGNTTYYYNHRLNLGDITQTIAPPLSPAIQTQDNSGGNSTAKMQVTLKTDNAIGTLTSPEATNQMWLDPHFIFFPNSGATAATLIVDGNARRVNLKPHPLLNGAFWLGDTDNPDAFNKESTSVAVAQNADLQPVRLRSRVATSATDNPFAFPTDNRNDVGDGTVLALQAATAALSEGQFGAHPMYAFTSQGIWALAPTATGGWSTVQPVSRDVMLVGTKPLSLDNAVVFATARGIMHLVGSKATVITAPIEGQITTPPTDRLLATLGFPVDHYTLVNHHAAPIRHWLDKAVLAYDYRHQRVYLATGNYGSWVLNLRTMQWTQSTTPIANALNAYPECEFIDNNNNIVTIGDNLKQAGLLITRPVKTGGEFFARLRDVAARSAGVKALAVYGTNDYNKYALVGSAYGARLTRHGGSPYRAHALLAVTDGTNVALDHFAIELDPTRRNRYRE